jgi:hypothetical protein
MRSFNVTACTAVLVLSWMTGIHMTDAWATNRRAFFTRSVAATVALSTGVFLPSSIAHAVLDDLAMPRIPEQSEGDEVSYNMIENGSHPLKLDSCRSL